MARRKLATVFGILAAAGALSAQPDAPPRFRWQAGQALTYKVAQQTVVQETTLDEKAEKAVTADTRTSLALTRVWTVKDVTPAGAATLEMRITALKRDIQQPDGKTIAVDSANPDDAKGMAAFLGQPVVVVVVDAQGRLAEVKETKGGSPSRLHAELPFRVVLPDAAPAPGKTWDRAFTLKLDPPLGAGEAHEFTQTYTAKGVQNGLMVLGVTTALKAPPKTAGEQLPLVPMLWTGDVYFNPAAGVYHAARLSAKAELTNHLGEGTKYVYQSTYSEDAVGK
ncbi:hypothetical protein J0H58_37125 [bacterium]|nr:hypothetical protein [bacterium]